jgi:mono/diheme cytochrome c family protein
MRLKILVFSLSSILLSTTVYAGGLLNGLFGGRRQAATVSCYPQQYQQTYQPTYQYYQPYQAVAAIPLATIPVAVDLQAYMYSVNSNAFQSFRDYMNTKSTVVQQDQPLPQPQHQQISQSVSDDPRIAGFQVLAKNCKSCHSGAKPKGDFSIFDQKGNAYVSLPWGKMIERISSPDPEVRMPPGKTLRVEDILSIVRLASPPPNMVYNPSDIGGTVSSNSQPEKVAFRSPFE